VRATPIVALTANAMPEDRERCLHAGTDDYLAKPIRIAQLAAAVERWGGGRAAGLAASAVAQSPPAPASTPAAASPTDAVVAP
jgi:two-component system sensor histidine kinase EvgS